MKGRPGFETTLYEEDLVRRGPPPPYRYVNIGFKGVTYRFPVNPGKRPRRKPGESPLDPPTDE